MNHVVCACGATFTENPIVSLLEHREREHSPHPVRYYLLVPEKPLAPNREAMDTVRRQRREQYQRSKAS